MFSISVITELDGLAKGQDTFGGVMGSGGRSSGSRGNYNVSATHVRAVQEKARLAVAFLERGFEAREPYLRALTSRGNQLESIAFRSEDTSGQQARVFSIISLFYYLLVIWFLLLARSGLLLVEHYLYQMFVLFFSDVLLYSSSG